MRLTMRVTSVGDRYMVRFPNAEHGADEWVKSDGRVDSEKVLDFFVACGPEFVQFSSKDDKGVLFAAYEFVWQLSCVVRHLAGDPNADCRLAAENAVDRSLDRKMERGKFAFVRMDFDRVGGSASMSGNVRARISCANPKDILGTAISSARDFAVDAARIMTHIAREASANTGGKAKIIVAEHDDEASRGIIDDAAKKDALQDADRVRRAKIEGRAMCKNRTASGYCSPINPACEFGCYCNGQCKEVA